MSDEPLAARLARLERERDEADRRYNDALTALDRAVARPVDDFPQAPPADTARLPDLNTQWRTLPAAPPADRSLKGRLRTFVWRMIGPPLEAQQTFNASVVEHLNRSAATDEALRQCVSRLSELARAEAGHRQRIESHLIQYLQTITWYVDTKDRAAGADALVLNEGLASIADDWMKRWESLQAREARFAAEVRAVLASLEDVRAASAIAQQTALSLKRDTEQLLARQWPAEGTTDAADSTNGGAASEAPRPDLDAHKYLAFENQFRGSVDDIRGRLREYLPRFDGRSDVLEIGCGRGEFLDLLRERGVSARGLDINEAMVQEARARGLDAVRAGALEYLAAQPDSSLGGLFAAQVVEHLPPDYLSRLIEVAGFKIRPGGVLIFETINPACWVAFFESYIRDLTHVRPLHPETLQFLVRAGGFRNVSIEFKSPVAEGQRLETFPPVAGDASSASGSAEPAPPFEELVERFNANVERLNARLFGYQDYAVVAER